MNSPVLKPALPGGGAGLPVQGELTRAFKPLWPSFRRVFIFSLVAGLLVLAPSIYMLEVYDRVVNSRSHMTLWMLTLVVLAAYAVMEFLEWVRSAGLPIRGLPRRDPVGVRLDADPVRAAALADHAAGQGVDEIAQRYGVPATTVRAWINVTAEDRTTAGGHRQDATTVGDQHRIPGPARLRLAAGRERCTGEVGAHLGERSPGTRSPAPARDPRRVQGRPAPGAVPGRGAAGRSA